MPEFWNGICTDGQSKSVISLAKDIAERISQQALRETFSPESSQVNFTFIDLSALSILYKVLQQVLDSSYYRIQAHKYFSSCLYFCTGLESYSLIDGWSQIGIVANVLDNNNHVFRNLLNQIDSNIESRWLIQANELKQKVIHSDLDLSDYDVVSGFSGVIGYLCSRNSTELGTEILRATIETAISLSLPPNSISNIEYTKYLSKTFGGNEGAINCGLAHGLPGVLAALSLAKISGINLNQLDETIYIIANWLISLANSEYFLWCHNIDPLSPNAIDLDEVKCGGWCYGSFGVLRSIWLAANALNDFQMKELVIKGILIILSRPDKTSTQFGYSICHGIAGRLHIALRFYNETGNEIIRNHAKELLDCLCSNFRQECIFGYQEINQAGEAEDIAGLVDGAAGIALVLLAASTNVEPIWDRLLMVS